LTNLSQKRNAYSSLSIFLLPTAEATQEYWTAIIINYDVLLTQLMTRHLPVKNESQARRTVTWLCKIGEMTIPAVWRYHAV